MNIGIVTTDGIEKNLTGINKSSKWAMTSILKKDKKNNYMFLDTNFLDLPIQEVKYPFLDGINVDIACYIKKIDIFHSYYRSFGDSHYSCKKVITIHDMIPMLHPEWFPNGRKDYFDIEIRKSAETSDAIIAVSESTKKDIIDCFGVDENKIKVIYWGNTTSTTSINDEDIAKVKKKYNVDRYIVSVCTLEPRKNLKSLVTAFLEYKRKNRSDDVRLVLTGKLGWGDEFLEDLLLYKSFEKDFVFAGYVDDNELKCLYSGALAMAYVSFYEGFGLPILEGMTMGKAVICSNTSSMPEVGGDAVEYCNPYDIDSIENAIYNVLNDDAYREVLREKAIKQSNLFSYDITAEKTIKLYEDLANDY